MVIDYLARKKYILALLAIFNAIMIYLYLTNVMLSQQVTRLNDVFYDDSIIGLESMAKIGFYAEENRAIIMEIANPKLHNMLDQNVALMTKNAELVNKYSKEYEGAIHHQEDKDNFIKLLKIRDDRIFLRDQIIQFARNNQYDKVNQLLIQNFVLFNSFFKQAEMMIQYNVDTANDYKQMIDEKAHENSNRYYISMLEVLLASILFAWLINKIFNTIIKQRAQLAQNNIDLEMAHKQIVELLHQQKQKTREEKTKRQHFEDASYHDTLTGLHNRNYYYQFIEELRRDVDDTSKKAFLFIDLDGFKQVNDTYGHLIGDELLKSVTKRLQDTVRQSDLIVRYGGDEFIVILNEIHHNFNASNLATTIINGLSEPFEIEEYTIQIGSSIGINIYDGNKENLDTILTHADRAMYQAKENGKNCFVFFEE